MRMHMQKIVAHLPLGQLLLVKPREEAGAALDQELNGKAREPTFFISTKYKITNFFTFDNTGRRGEALA